MVKIEHTFRVNWTIVILLFVMWLGIMVLFFLKADEVTKDPCSICAEKQGEDVMCYAGDLLNNKRIYHPNNTINEDNTLNLGG